MSKDAPEAPALTGQEMQLGQGPPAPVVVRPRQPRRVSVRPAIPDSILLDPDLLRAVASSLPPNYSFEVPKTVWRVREAQAHTVALQFPEGLLMFASTLADILERFAGVKQCIILGDVTYGACCIDDITASMLGAQLLVHYGHSCLVPVGKTVIPCLYVFVGLTIDTPHLVSTIEHNLPAPTPLVLAGTIQFSAAVQQASTLLREHQRRVTVPQAKPLSPGEVLGCTAPTLELAGRRATGLGSQGTQRGASRSGADHSAAVINSREAAQERSLAATTAAVDCGDSHASRRGATASAGEGEGAGPRPEAGAGAGAGADAGAGTGAGAGAGTGSGAGTEGVDAQEVLVFVADGRFHLEAMMIANPALPAYRYDPFTRKLLREEYDHRGMRNVRRSAVQRATHAQHWGVVLGTLGRQGNTGTLDHVCQLLRSQHRHATVFLVSELSPAKVSKFEGAIEAWVQIACPRLSIDWGEAFCAPLLTPYELTVALGRQSPWWRPAQPSPKAREVGSMSMSPSHVQLAEVSSKTPSHAQSLAADEDLDSEVDSEGLYPMDYYAKQGLGSWSRNWP